MPAADTSSASNVVLVHGGIVDGSGWEVGCLLARDDRMIPPPAQRFMAKRAGATAVEVAGSHAVYVSRPAAVAGLIAKACKAAGALAHSR